MEEKALFGGAIACRLPVDSVDLSDIRQVPSHQECWFLETDQRASIAFTLEILERPAQDEAVHEHEQGTNIVAVLFRDLAEANDATAYRIVAEPYPVAPPNLAPQSIDFDCVCLRATGEWTTATPTPAVSSLLAAGNTNNNGDHNYNDVVNKNQVMHVEMCVIRLPAQAAEILLTILVPIERLRNDEHDHGFYTGLARHWMDEMIASFRVRNWGLFGG